MSANCIQEKKFAQMNEELTIDNMDQSTTNQSKQSNATLSMAFPNTDNNYKYKPIKTQRSLLSLTPQISQRRSSKSLIEQTYVIEEEPQIQGQNEVFLIYWYDQNIDHKYEIIIQAHNNITIGDLIQLFIQQFNEQNQYLQTPFSSDVHKTNIYELFIPKKKKGNPNEDFPAFANQTMLNQTNLKEFSLKITTKQITNYSSTLLNPQNSSASKPNTKQRQSLTNSSQKKKKNFFQKLFFCCNHQAEEF
ncbi:unnamed protein product [Paramecium primaurelia]|uniref:Uncharacterized protein n=1 Tax=Paramecium primaurelia TaxID=5886 RepID=A0A8S1JP79_PARPR|nr:unnamed protein product [Paramecium primaurelia]